MSRNGYKRIGDYIRVVNNRNKDIAVKNLLGLNINKLFMPSVANTSGVDLSKYKIVMKNQFATNIMHVDRDEILPIALYPFDDPAIVSPAYVTFEVINKELLLPEYLMMEFQRSEFDRRAWTYCDSSVRGGLEWSRFCDIEIPIPDIEEQKKYVALYKGLLANQRVYEKSLTDLQLICNTFIENLIKTESLKILGEYIEQSDERNFDLTIEKVQGVSITKQFIETKANMNGVSIHDYKVVKKGYFAFNPNTARMGEKICVALNDGVPCIVSKIYPVFKVMDDTNLLPEFLQLWFRRSEFDRYARFHSWGSARETFDWSDMCEVRLPIPDIKVQEAIVSIYHTLETRKRINEQLKNTIKPLCPVLMRGAVENMDISEVSI